MILSHSSRMDFTRCRRLFYLRRILKIYRRLPEMALPVRLGMIWDKFIQSYYNGIKFRQDFEALVDEYNISNMDASKLSGLISAFTTIGMQQSEESPRLQNRFDMVHIVDGVKFEVIGYVDRAYNDHFVETKLSSRPDFYTKVHNISSQVGTYFLSDEDMKYCIMEVVRLPDLRTGKGKKSDEEPDEYMRRTKGDILSKPSHYFIGFDRNKRTFGKRFWRKEFDLDELVNTYEQLAIEINRILEQDRLGNDSVVDMCYKSYACYTPGECAYLPICETGVISEALFETKKQKGGDDDNTEGGGEEAEGV